MLEKYLRVTTYHYKIHASFVKDGMNHIVATEFGPGSDESNFFILFEANNQIFNQDGNLCAIIENGEIVIIEE